MPNNALKSKTLFESSAGVDSIQYFNSVFFKILQPFVPFFLLQHFVFLVGVMIDVVVPDIPEELDLKIKRERFLARQALSHIPDKVRNIDAHPSFMGLIALYPSRTSTHFLQEPVKFHFQDLGRQCIILASILEDLGRKCLILQDLARNVRILEVTWKKMPDLGSNLKKMPDLGSNL